LGKRRFHNRIKTPQGDGAEVIFHRKILRGNTNRIDYKGNGTPLQLA